jgi:S1-C subfamily serine protease
MPSELTQRQYVALLAGVSVAILSLGTWLKPKKAPEVTISQAEMIRLQALTQRKNLEDLSGFFSGIAQKAAPHLVWVSGLETSGVIWDNAGTIVAPAPREPLMQPLSVAAGASEMRVEPAVFSENFPVAALKAPAGSGLQPVEKGSTGTLDPGKWIVGVSRRNGGKFLVAPGVYAGTVPAACGDFEYQEVQSSLPLTQASLGGGLFNLDAELIAVVVACGSRYTAVTPSSVDTILKLAGSLEGQLLQRYGLRVRPLDAESQAYFKVQQGALVTEVWKGRPADTTGLTPGDVIVALDDEPVNSPDSLYRLVLPVARPAFDLKVSRGRKTVILTLPANGPEAPVVSSGDYGLHLVSSARGYLIEAVDPGSRAHRASIQSGDRLLQVGLTRSTSLAAIRRALSANDGTPTYVVLERGPRKLGVFLR